MSDENQSKCRAVCLISGGGTNLQAIIDNIKDKSLKIDLISVISDNPAAKGLQRAEKEGIDTTIFDFSSFDDRKQFDQCLEKEMVELDPDQVQPFPSPSIDQIVCDHQKKRNQILLYQCLLFLLFEVLLLLDCLR